MGAKAISIYENNPEFPQVLKNLDNQPKKLSILGNYLESDWEGITVVGSRRMTSYGKDVVESIVGEVVTAGFTIISGLAFGVDTTSSELALNLGGRTIAVLGSGINNIRPQENLEIAKRIIESGQGAIISQFEPNTDGSKQTFPKRDYLMAALGSRAGHLPHLCRAGG